MRWFFLLLPWFELFTLISLGSEIGALATLAYVFATFVLGISLIRYQGMEMMGRLRTAQQGGMVMGQMLGDELALGLAGLLLLIPGLFTDSLALLVLLGPLRRRVAGFFGAQRDPGSVRGGASQPFREPPGAPHEGRSSPETLEGEFRRLDD